MRLFGLMVVRNAADLLRVNLRHHLAQGVERFLVFDHASADETPAILEAFAAEGRVEWARVDGPFRCERWVNDLAAEAYLQGADWVLPVDSDEFWTAGERRIVDLLEATEAAALEVDVVNFVQQRDQQASVPDALLRMVHRVAEPVPAGAEGIRRVEDGSLAFVALAYSPKWISRASPALRIARGNHGVSGLAGRSERRDDLVCLHAPLRSRAAFDQRRETELEPNIPPGDSWHLRRWVAMEDGAALAAEWEANTAAGDRLGREGMALVVDPRLRDLVRPWLEPGGEKLEGGFGIAAPPAVGALGEGAVAVDRVRPAMRALRRELERARRAEESLGREVTALRAEVQCLRGDAERRERETAQSLQVLEAIRSSRFFRLWMASIRVRRAVGLARDRVKGSRRGRPRDLGRQLEERGFAAPVAIFDGAECRRLLDRLRADPPRPREWGKDLAVSSRLMYEIAADPRIADRVAAVLGPEVVLWGASLLERPPGAEHPWHSDIETATAQGTVSVWIGLEGACRASALSLVPYSHRFGVTLQQEARDAGKRRGEASTEDVAEWARRRHRLSGVVLPDVTDGDAILFDGRLWHGSHNTTASTRTALLLQYARASTPIRIADLSRLEWPVRLLEEPRPPCLVIRGEHPGDSPNRIAAPPPPVGSGAAAPPLETSSRAIELPLAGDPATGWKPHPCFLGATPNLASMSCHVSVLEPERCPHPPHQHPEEEILVVLDGEADLVLVDGAGEEEVHRVQRGDFAYYPAGQLHTLRTPAGARATYLMFKWTGRAGDAADPLATSVIRHDGPAGSETDAGEGFVPRFVLESPTRWLRRLHCHLSTVAPGAGYEPHVDDHDVALVLLEGAIETAGVRLCGTGVAYLPAGEAHGMHNPGSVPARYLVFELHGNSPHRLVG